MAYQFPEIVPFPGDVIELTFSCGMVRDVVVRHRTKMSGGEINIELWMSHHDSGFWLYGRVLNLIDGKWYVERLGDQTTHEVQLNNLMSKD